MSASHGPTSISNRRNGGMPSATTCYFPPHAPTTTISTVLQSRVSLEEPASASCERQNPWLAICSCVLSQYIFFFSSPFLLVSEKDYYKVRVKQGRNIFNNWQRFIPNLNEFLQTNKKNTNISNENYPIMWISYSQKHKVTWLMNVQ